MTVRKVEGELAEEIPSGMFRWVEGEVNANQDVLHRFETELLRCARKAGRWASWGRGLSVALAALIPVSQIAIPDTLSHGFDMKIVAGVLGALAAFVGGVMSHFKFEARAQGARVLAALAEAKRQSVKIDALSVRMVKCPRVRVGEAIGLLTAQQNCLEHIRGKATELELSFSPDARPMHIDLDQEFRPGPRAFPDGPEEIGDEAPQGPTKLLSEIRARATV